jgi:hypothetical protein
VTTISSGSQTTQVSRPHAGSRQPTRGIATRRHRPTIARGPQPPMGMWVFAPRSPAIHLPRSIRSAPVRTQPPSRSHSRPPQIHPDLGLGTGRVRVPATNRCPQRQPSQLRPGLGGAYHPLGTAFPSSPTLRAGDVRSPGGDRRDPNLRLPHGALTLRGTPSQGISRGWCLGRVPTTPTREATIRGALRRPD